MPRELDVCKHCGQKQEEHHLFTPVVIPDGCKCSLHEIYPEDLLSLGKPICATHKGAQDDWCEECSHAWECHQ